MKVLHVCSYYITSKLYRNLIENLEDRGIYNDVYIPVNSEELINKFSGTNTDKSKYIYSKCFNKIDRVSFRLKNKKIYEDLVNTIDLENIDVSHAHSLFVNGYVAYKLKKEKNIDYIVAVRNTDVNTFFKKMIHLRKIGVEIMKNAKQIIFISPKYKQYVIDTYIPNDLKKSIEEKSVVIPNGIDKFWFDNLNMKEKIIEKDNVSLIYVGKLDKNKNLYTSMKAIKKLNELGYKATLDIVGNGDELDTITNLAKNEYKDMIKLHGYMNKEDIITLYRKSDIFIMPSKYETFGLVYIEAISQGVPVIYTRNQGFDGYFEDGKVGFSVKYDDVDEIVEKIITMINTKWNLDKIEDILRQDFVWGNIAKTYDEIYSER
ncbi:MAG: glycosyltransferase family 4 protein [Romboutsia sp.]